MTDPRAAAIAARRLKEMKESGDFSKRLEYFCWFILFLLMSPAFVAMYFLIWGFK